MTLSFPTRRSSDLGASCIACAAGHTEPPRPKTKPRLAAGLCLVPQQQLASVDVGLGVMHIELAGRGDDAWIRDHRLELAGLVVPHHDRRLLLLAVPDREPPFIALDIVLGLHPTGRASCRERV